MTTDEEQNADRAQQYAIVWLGGGLASGVAVGAGIGILISDLAMGLGIGIAMGAGGGGVIAALYYGGDLR